MDQVDSLLVNRARQKVSETRVTTSSPALFAASSWQDPVDKYVILANSPTRSRDEIISYTRHSTPEPKVKYKILDSSIPAHDVSDEFYGLKGTNNFLSHNGKQGMPCRNNSSAYDEDDDDDDDDDDNEDDNSLIFKTKEKLINGKIKKYTKNANRSGDGDAIPVLETVNADPNGTCETQFVYVPGYSRSKTDKNFFRSLYTNLSQSGRRRRHLVFASFGIIIVEALFNLLSKAQGYDYPFSKPESFREFIADVMEKCGKMIMLLIFFHFVSLSTKPLSSNYKRIASIIVIYGLMMAVRVFLRIPDMSWYFLSRFQYQELFTLILISGKRATISSKTFIIATNLMILFSALYFTMAKDSENIKLKISTRNIFELSLRLALSWLQIRVLESESFDREKGFEGLKQRTLSFYRNNNIKDNFFKANLTRDLDYPLASIRAMLLSIDDSVNLDSNDLLDEGERIGISKTLLSLNFMDKEHETLINEILKSFQDLNYLFTNLSDLHQLSIPIEKLNPKYVSYNIYSGSSEVDLRDLVYGIVSELSLQSGVPIVFDDKNLLASHAVVSIDVKLLSKALCHLIQNAIKYADGGRITVQIRSLDSDMNRAARSSSNNRLNVPKKSPHSSPSLRGRKQSDFSTEYEIIQIPFRNALISNGTFSSDTPSLTPPESNSRRASMDSKKDPNEIRKAAQGGALGLNSMRVYDSQSIEMLGSDNRAGNRKTNQPSEIDSQVKVTEIPPSSHSEAIVSVDADGDFPKYSKPQFMKKRFPGITDSNSSSNLNSEGKSNFDPYSAHPSKSNLSLQSTNYKHDVPNSIRTSDSSDSESIRNQQNSFGDPFTIPIVYSFMITDEGDGLDHDVWQALQRYKAPFVFKDAPDRRCQGKAGTGLGLLITSKIVERLGGKFLMHSRKGIGTQAGFKLTGGRRVIHR